MQKLKSDINDLINENNQNWVTAITEADKKEEGIDLTKMFGKYSEIMKKKDTSFQDAEQRLRDNKKGFLG